MERRKLFSEEPKPARRKLFSTPEARNIKLFSDTAEEEAFQRTFSDTNDEIELKLKEYSGKTIGPDEFASVFGGLDIEERGFAQKGEDGNYTISPGAFCESRMFSKITISVTKTFELDPAIMAGQPKEDIIDSLEEGGKFPPKAIILLKKAHQIPADKDNDRYLNDSGLVRDLPLEFGGKPMPKPDFMKIIHERYEDAPTDIMEVLKNKGIVKIDGDNVEIIK